jgi:hypothetical protein
MIKMHMTQVWSPTPIQHGNLNPPSAKECCVSAHKQLIMAYHYTDFYISSKVHEVRKRKSERKVFKSLFWSKGIDLQFISRLTDESPIHTQDLQNAGNCWSWMMNIRAHYAILYILEHFHNTQFQDLCIWEYLFINSQYNLVENTILFKVFILHT